MKREIKLLRPQLHDFELFTERARQIFESGWITNSGPFERQLEEQITSYLHAPTVAVSSGTAALLLALKGLKLKGNVIVPSFTFCATAHALSWAGLEPNFVDIDPETFTIDPQKVREAINEDTSAILAVHVFGNPCAIDKLVEIAKEYNLTLLFDAAHAFGSTYKGKKIGSFGDAEIFSTHATKLFISGEGGLVATHKEHLHNYVRKARNFGIENPTDTSFIGLNAKMSELHAIIGLDSLAHISTAIEKRQSLATQYISQLKDVAGIRFQKIEPGATSNYFYVSMLVDPAVYGLNRDQLAELLEQKGVQTRKYFYLPLHQQRAYKKYNRASLPHTERVASSILCFPTNSAVSEEDVAYICTIIKEAASPNQNVIRKNNILQSSSAALDNNSRDYVGRFPNNTNNNNESNRPIPNNIFNSHDPREIRRVLVTGGAGYIGCILVKKLLEKGYAVRVLDQLIFGKEPLAELINSPHPDLHVGLVEDKYIVEKCMQGVDAVIHLSGLSNDPSCEINPELTRKSNIDATKIILDVAKANNIKRFIYASSCSAYGFTGDTVVTEESPLNPLTAYAKSKVDCENLIIPAASDDFVTVCLRKATVYGPSPRMRFDLVINTMTGMALSEGKITINGGQQWRPFVHVEDAADAYIFMLEAPKENINGQVFNIGDNNQNIKIIDLAQEIRSVIPEAQVELSESPDTRSYHVNFDKINRLGWKASKTICDGIVDIKEMFDKGQVKNFRDLNYFNIKRMITYLNV